MLHGRWVARIVLTCRVNLWDGSINALDDFDTYRTLDFSYPQQVERFIHKWFAAIPETGKQLCTALKESGEKSSAVDAAVLKLAIRRW
ncbi:hypothetical protein NIES4075_06620 [Tolypothrix sp. NIES-4075]|uniref:hypothetical protein n=1 Tax=Tolypothrix sp. NIES-4075 TaxID=2005459 RepID=UPI000B6BDF05|nr:hypothetical protein [Tolypothrix sp. NIES-4075]GAX39706.1 hypothetical protein NIES4075_06620 [Tolypothrix sp. NIES-4075]